LKDQSDSNKENTAPNILGRIHQIQNIVAVELISSPKCPGSFTDSDLLLSKGIFQLATETKSINFPVGTKFQVQPLLLGPVLEATVTGNASRPLELRSLNCTGVGISKMRGHRPVIQGDS